MWRSHEAVRLSRQTRRASCVLRPDSVIFVQKNSEPPLIECGDALGVITSELKENEYLSKFVSGGPKKYAYKLCKSVAGGENTVCKA
jgi:hypothetical protein